MEKHAVIGDVRGKGLFCGAELVADRKTKEPLDEKHVQAVVAECLGQGVIIGATNRSLHDGLNNTLCLPPALIATPEDIDRITDAIGNYVGAPSAEKPNPMEPVVALDVAVVQTRRRR
ncbi:aminotransferase class III-fold pyridoxal phosphate-dependent enzyme [Rhizobium aouanii]|uniref:Aminotransferase class III-fold pyridoxal phosphate-dependent enzyme n=2 Tax=Rhizobium/Agrobacterium group TaxID=227290 RepID=A0ABU8CKP1_9HYPH